MTQEELEQARDEGFRDGVKFVVTQILAAANKVRANKQPYFAGKLEELATELNKVITQ